MTQRRFRSRWLIAAIFGVCLVLFNVVVIAAGQRERPVDAFASAGITQKPGAQVPLTAPFHDASGQTVHLSDYTGALPILLIPGYFHCTNLCDTVRQAVQTSLGSLPLTAGKDFQVVAFSIDPTETSADASQAQSDFMFGLTSTSGIHFLTGERTSIDPVMQSIGFQYAYDATSQQYAHPAGIVLLTPTGAVSRYFFGVTFPAEQLRLGLVDASGSRIGGVVDQVLLRCFHYDPTTGRYSLLITNVTTLAGIATVLILGASVAVMFRHDNNATRRREG